MTNDDKLTSTQVDALTHAWLDLSAVAIGGSVDLEVACADSVVELETAFPFLRDQPSVTG
jgi:hypothetical protein